MMKNMTKLCNYKLYLTRSHPFLIKTANDISLFTRLRENNKASCVGLNDKRTNIYTEIKSIKCKGEIVDLYSILDE